MDDQKFPVTIKPQGRVNHVLAGTRLFEAVVGAGVMLDGPCGGEGTCGKCRLTVSDGADRPTSVEQAHISADDLALGVRLACQARVRAATAVEVPVTSIVAAHHQILTHAERPEPIELDPPVRKRFVELPKPERGSDEADLIRLERELGPLEVDVEMIRKLPAKLRKAEFQGTAVMDAGRLLDFEPGDTADRSLAVAFDVGTTTLAASLIDLNTGREIAVSSRLNPQTTLGDDVLSRILHAREAAQGLGELHEMLTEAIDEMVGELARQAGIGRRDVYQLTFSGNTTMQQLLCRIDTRSLGEVPFVPTCGHSLQILTSKLGIRIHPRGRAYVLPVIGGFVGGDTVAGILATGLDESAEPTLLVDIGTNGEIVLAAGGQLIAASTAAGPAFEGARISQGMRAAAGAIEKVIADELLHVNTIGNIAPVGLCGSALIDLAAELLRLGVLTSDGRLLADDGLPDELPDDLRRRAVSHEGSTAFVLADRTESGTDRPVVVTQRDLRELQLATGAIRAGILLLLRHAGLTPADLETVYIAGGFGNFIRRKNAQRIGLLPPEIRRHRILFQGNTSLRGAGLAAVSRTARRQARDVARRTRHVDLSRDPEFQMAFAEAMIFPKPEK